MIVRSRDKVLMGRRKGAHGAGTWSFPGGHLEFNETIEACAEREVLEETGMRIVHVRPALFTNDIFDDEGKHYVTLFVVADHESGEPVVREPEKCETWDWFAWDALPDPLFIPVRHLLQQNFSPF